MRPGGRHNAEGGRGKDEGNAEPHVVSGPKNLQLHFVPPLAGPALWRRERMNLYTGRQRCLGNKH